MFYQGALMSNEITQVNRQLPSTTSAQSKAIAAAEEVKCFFLAALQFPRDTQQCKQEIINACTDKMLAEEALYSYRRGGQLVEGPSIDLVEEVATIWGRISSGWEIVDSTPEASQVIAFAIDFQTLKKDSRTFWVEHKGAKGNRLTEARDIYETIANMAQRRKRTCIEAMIPKHVMNAAVAQVIETLKAGDPKPMADRVKLMAQAFYDSHGVTKAMLEKKLGSKLEAMTDTQLVALRAIFKSLKDGAKTEDYFDVTLGTIVVESTGEVVQQAEDKKTKGKPAKTKTDQKNVQTDSSAANSPESSESSTSTTSNQSATVTATTEDITPDPTDWNTAFG